MRRGYMWATAALAGPASGMISQRLNPASLRQSANCAPVKSKASPSSIGMSSDIRRPRAFCLRPSSMIVLDRGERAAGGCAP